MAEQKKPAGEAKKRKLVKGRHRSAIKRQRQNLKRAAANLGVRSRIKGTIKKVLSAAQNKDKNLAQTLLREANSLLFKAARKQIIHPRNAARHLAKLSSLVHSLG